MSNFKTFVIANPRAGAGQVEREWERIERMLQANLPEMDYAFTEGPEHATLLAREALRAGWEMVVAIGGDGTFNEVVNGFFDRPQAESHFALEDGWIRRTNDDASPINPDAVLGMLPMGTGGDFRRSIGLMGDIKENVERLGGQHTRVCDIGQITFVGHDGKLTSRYFINIASAGFSGAVDAISNGMWKGLGGRITFSIASTRAWMVWKNRRMQVRLDEVDEVEDAFVNVVVANGEFFGGGMWVAPGAEIDDAEFQVVFMGDLGKLDQVRVMSKIYNGHHLEMDKIFRRRASQVAMRPSEGEGDVLIDVDGEQPGRLPALYNIHHQAIRLKV